MSDIWEENLDKMFSPTIVAVIGASRRDGSIGKAILKNIIDYKFEGTVYPINPNTKSVYGIHSYPSLKDVPEPIDLIIIVVPANLVIQTLQEAKDIGVKAAVIITAGFKEIGGLGLELENQIISIAKEGNIRLVGPNCMGILHAHYPYLNATFAPGRPLPGKIGFISQSGALGVVILEYATQLGLGFSKFVSLGNKADVNATYMIENLRKDPNTDVILAYLESFSDPWNFSEIATKTSREKPIIVVKSGRTAAGKRAALSHTGAIASTETAITATLSRSGVVRVNSVEELFDCAMAFSKLNLPNGDRVAIITNSGGPGTLATDTLVSSGLKLAEFNDETKNKMHAILPPEASINNPIDMIASGGPLQYDQSIEILLHDENVDSLIVIFVPPMMINQNEIAEIINKHALKRIKPILACIMGRNELIEGKHNFAYPMYRFPEAAVLSLKALTSYAIWKQQPEKKIETLVTRENKDIYEMIKKAKDEGQQTLNSHQIHKLFEAYDFQFPNTEIVTSYDELIEVMNKLNYPVVLKMASAKVLHKTDEGGVLLDIRNEVELSDGWNKLMKNYDRLDVSSNDRDVIVQEYYPGGVEMALGISVDVQFGPILMVGSGGIFLEVLDDVTFEMVPVSRIDARKMIRKLKGYPLLLGFRGDNPVDIKALEDCIIRLSQMASENRDIIELDINPLLLLEVGSQPIILDARVSIQ